MLSLPCKKCSMTFADMLQLRKHQNIHLLKTYTKRCAGPTETPITKLYKNKSEFYKTEVKELHNENEHGKIIDKQEEQFIQKMYDTPEKKKLSKVQEQYKTDVYFVTEDLEPGEIDASKQDIETGEIVYLDK